VETAPNGRLALRKIDTFDPDVVTMDVEMPGMGHRAWIGSMMPGDLP
jgi:chemotaxis response regulator CheB